MTYWTTFHQNTKNYNLYSHFHENVQCHYMNIEHLQMVEVDQRLTNPETYLRLIINTTQLCCKHYFQLPYMHTNIWNRALFTSTNAVTFIWTLQHKCHTFEWMKTLDKIWGTWILKVILVNLLWNLTNAYDFLFWLIPKCGKHFHN